MLWQENRCARTLGFFDARYAEACERVLSRVTVQAHTANVCRDNFVFRCYDALVMLAKKLLPACCALIASTAATAWAQQPKSKGTSSNAEQRTDMGWRPIAAFGVVGGYGQLPGPAIGWTFAVGFRFPAFSIGFELRSFYDILVENPKAPNIHLFNENAAFPLCVHSRYLYGCLIVQLEKLSNIEWPVGVPLTHYKDSTKLGIALRGGFSSPPIQRILDVTTSFRPYLELGIYASPRRIEINDNVLWQSGMLHFAMGCTYGI